MPRHWHDALALLVGPMDWEYLLHRARKGPPPDPEPPPLRRVARHPGAGERGAPAVGGVSPVSAAHTEAEYVCGEVQRALAADPALAELGIEITVLEGAIELRGVVATAERRARAVELVRRLFPDLRVDERARAPGDRSARPAGGGALIRIAAVGDLHLGDGLRSRRGATRSSRSGTRPISCSSPATSRVGGPTRRPSSSCACSSACECPIFAVLGNHDHDAEREDEIVQLLASGGVAVLEGSYVTTEIAGATVGVAGAKGFGGGFAGACGQRVRRARDEGVHRPHARARGRARARARGPRLRRARGAPPLRADRGDAPRRAPRDLPVPRELPARRGDRRSRRRSRRARPRARRHREGRDAGRHPGAERRAARDPLRLPALLLRERRTTHARPSASRRIDAGTLRHSRGGAMR